MASRREIIDPYTTKNISDAIVIQNLSEVPIFWSNDPISDVNKGNRLGAKDTIALKTAGVYVRNDTCFEDIEVQVEPVRP